MSRSYDRAVALKRLEKAGCQLTTSEAAIFDLVRTADHPKFKEISKLVKLSVTDEKTKTILERTAMTCPVFLSLNSDVEKRISFNWK